MSHRPPQVRYFRLVFALAVAAGLAGATAANPAAPVVGTRCFVAPFAFAAATAPQRFDDVIEETAGPDICGSNIVTNDNRFVTIAMHLHNRDGFVDGEIYAAYLDTDRNPTTGYGGAEYAVSSSTRGGALDRFNGTAFEPVSTRVLTAWADGYGPVIEFPRAAIRADGFDFVLEAKGVEADRAPDVGAWSYELRPLRLRTRDVVTGAAVAGRRFTVTARVLASDWNTELEDGRVVCEARLGLTRLRGNAAFTNRRVSCSWRLPRRSAGRLVTGAVGASYQGASDTAPFRVRVRR